MSCSTRKIRAVVNFNAMRPRYGWCNVWQKRKIILKCLWENDNNFVNNYSISIQLTSLESPAWVALQEKIRAVVKLNATRPRYGWCKLWQKIKIILKCLWETAKTSWIITQLAWNWHHWKALELLYKYNSCRSKIICNTAEIRLVQCLAKKWTCNWHGQKALELLYKRNNVQWHSLLLNVAWFMQTLEELRACSLGTCLHCNFAIFKFRSGSRTSHGNAGTFNFV